VDPSSPDRVSVAASAVERLVAELGADVVDSRTDRSATVVVVVARERIVEALTLLRDDESLGFRVLADLTAVDYLTTGREPRFDVVYQLLARAQGARIRLIARVPEGDEVVPSVTGVFPAADWLEREVFDLMGIRFAGHPNLRRLELPDDYDGHPLRRDFPVRGGDRQVRRPEDPAPVFGHRFRVR
jgi:NADH-quinone oxidoreductase subunit C